MTEINRPLSFQGAEGSLHTLPRGWGRKEETLWRRMGVGGAADHTAIANVSHVPLSSGLYEFSQAALPPALLADTVIIYAAQEVGLPAH